MFTPKCALSKNEYLQISTFHNFRFPLFDLTFATFNIFIWPFYVFIEVIDVYYLTMHSSVHINIINSVARKRIINQLMIYMYKQSLPLTAYITDTS